ncbi:MAG: DUF3108 domain-containing protein [Nitrospirae bacterium]|nr:DUF3108 domain-containing protein [Nitrospirota bacterium]
MTSLFRKLKDSHISGKITLLLFPVFAFLAYLPAFVFEFALHNDYSRFMYKGYYFAPWLQFPETINLILEGRPIGALFLNIQFIFLESISDFTSARLISFLVSIYASLLIAYYLIHRLSLSRLWPLMITFCIVMLPSSQVYIVWATNFVPGALNILLVIVSYMILDKAGRYESTFGKLATLTIAQAVFLITLFIYPPTSLSILLFPFMRIVFSEFSSWHETRRIVLRDMVFMVSGIAIYFILQKFVILPFLLTIPSISSSLEYISALQNPKYHFSLTTDFLDKVRLFYRLSETAISGIWHPIFGIGAGKIIFAIFLAGIIFVTYRFKKSDTVKSIGKKRTIYWSMQIGLALGVLLLLANTPILLSKGSFVEYRIFFPYASFIVIAEFGLLYRIRQALGHSRLRHIPLTIGILLVIASFSLTLKNTLNTAQNANMELNFVRQKVASADFSHIKRILLLRLPWASTLSDKKLTYEFSRNTANYNPVRGLIHAVLAENNIKQDIPIDVRSKFTDSISIENATLVIDMNDARVGRSKTEYSGMMDKKYQYQNFEVGARIVKRLYMKGKGLSSDMQKSAFDNPERLSYSLKWSGIKAGTALLEIKKVSDDTTIITATVKSSKYISTFYPVEDTLSTTLLDDRLLLPLSYHMDMKEGVHRKNKEVIFHHKDNAAIMFDHVNSTTQTWDVEVSVLRKEKIKTPLGIFDTIVVKSSMRSASKKNEIRMWLSDDERRLPVRVKMKVKVGSITAELVDSK